MRVLRISDGKRGHDNQSLGLTEALARIRCVRIDTITIHSRSVLAAWRTAHEIESKPDLIIAAGHGTHLTTLFCARTSGARSVVLMKPTLPVWLFDLCVIPQHDGVAPGRHVITSVGALNRVRAGNGRDASKILVLIGGPSPHLPFDDELLHQQIEALSDAAGGRQLLLIASRRTPREALARWSAITATTAVAFEQTDSEWLAKTLPQAETVWVTEDSVSMAFEAASAGARIGILAVTPRPSQTRSHRVARALQSLVDQGRAAYFDHWRSSGELPPVHTPLAEADRVAHEIVNRWPTLD